MESRRMLLSNARGVYMLQAMGIGIASATCFGLSGAFISATFCPFTRPTNLTKLKASPTVDSAALPFMVCSSLGFAFGQFYHYQSSCRSALQALLLYPELMHFHLMLEASHLLTVELARSQPHTPLQYPSQARKLNQRSKFYRWRAEAIGGTDPWTNQGGWVGVGDLNKRSMSVAALMAASSSIAKIREQKEESIVESFQDQRPSLDIRSTIWSSVDLDDAKDAEGEPSL